MAAVVLGVGLAAGGTAQAQEYCVACAGPDAVYRCVVEASAPPGLPLKMLCVTTLAKEGGHATCSVRGGTVFDCKGPIRRVSAAAGAVAPAVPTGSPAPVPASTPPAPPPGDSAVDRKPGPKQPPQTVEQLARDVGQSSGDGLSKAGAAITRTTRKAWDCVTSLFNSC
jgi:hypothetical protein